MTVIISLLLLFLSLFLIYLPGLFLTSFLILKEKQKDLSWIIAPFLGMVFNILILQNLVYLNVTLSQSSLPYFFTLLIIAITFAKYWIRHISKPPLLVLCGALIVLLPHAFGYFLTGYKHYIGYGWIDQFNYTAMAQFLMDFPFKTGINDVGNTPYLVSALSRIHTERFGQSIVQGFIACVSGLNAKGVYGSVALLSPFLTFLSAWALSSHLSYQRWQKLTISICCALIPGIAKLHLQCFLSNSLAVPFLLLYPITLSILLENPLSWRNILLNAFVFAGMNAIYTEFTSIIVVLSFIGLGTDMALKRPWNLKPMFGVISLLLIGLLINPFFLTTAIKIISSNQNSVPNILSNVYPFALTVEGITRLWFGVSFEKFGAKIITLTNFISLLLTFLSFTGFMFLLRRQGDVVVSMLFALLLLPLLIFSSVLPYPYQYYKILLSVSPIFVFGLWEFSYKEWNKIIPAGLIQIFLFLLAAYYIFLTPFLSSLAKTGKGSSIVPLSHSADTIARYEHLEKTMGQDFLISGSHPFRIAWMSYHGRENRFWFMNDLIGDVPLKIYPKNFIFNDLNTLPDSVHVVSDGENYPKILPPDAEQFIASFFYNPQGMEKDNSGNFNWLGDKIMPFKMEIYSLYKIEFPALLSFRAEPGEGYSAKSRVIELKEEGNKIGKSYSFNSDAMISHRFKLNPGKNILYLTTLFPEQADTYLGGDPRSLLIKISNVTLTIIKGKEK